MKVAHEPLTHTHFAARPGWAKRRAEWSRRPEALGLPRRAEPAGRRAATPGVEATHRVETVRARVREEDGGEWLVFLFSFRTGEECRLVVWNIKLVVCGWQDVCRSNASTVYGRFLIRDPFQSKIPVDVKDFTNHQASSSIKHHQASSSITVSSPHIFFFCGQW